ncbi:MAG: glycosyltransferase family 2 protein [Phycisphaeraceae bacterium]
MKDEPVTHASMPRPPVSVIILTLNEEINIRACIASCEWCDDIHVVDSGSTDRTQDIARELGANVHYHQFISFGKQRNWAIDNVKTKHPWIFHLDADERFTDNLVRAVGDLLDADPKEAGFHVPHKVMFMGRWLKRSAGYPNYQMRLFHKERMRFIDYGHGQREIEHGKIGTLDVPYLHFSFSKGIYDWLDKHNRYSTLEAIQVLMGNEYEWEWKDLLFANKIKRRRAWKELTYRLPFRSKLRWIGILFIHGGILEGRAGLAYANLMAIYDNMTMTKIKVLRSQVEICADGLPPSLREPNQQFEPMDTPYTRSKARKENPHATDRNHAGEQPQQAGP